MPYVDPINWMPGQVVTAANLNEQVSENMRSLHERTIGAAAAQHLALPLTGLTIDNGSQTIVHLGANSDLQITTTGGDILYTVAMRTDQNNAGPAYSVRVDNGSWVRIDDGDDVAVSHIIANIAAGTHTLQFGFRNATIGEIFLIDAREIVGAA